MGGRYRGEGVGCMISMWCSECIFWDVIPSGVSSLLGESMGNHHCRIQTMYMSCTVYVYLKRIYSPRNQALCIMPPVSKNHRVQTPHPLYHNHVSLISYCALDRWPPAS